MKVFNACCTVIRRRASAFLLYMVIFIALAGLMTTLTVKQNDSAFAQTKTDVAVINRDGTSALSAGMTAYLKENAHLVELPDDKQTLQDALFYHEVTYILFIPKGFAADFAAGGTMTLEEATVPDAAEGLYTGRLIDNYLSTARLYQTSLPHMDESRRLAAVAEDLSLQTPVEKKTFGAGGPVDESFTIYYRFFGYILVVLMILATSVTMMVFNRSDLRMRCLCAPVRLRSMNAQLALCNGALGVVFWALLVAVGFVLYGGKLGGADPQVILLCLLNSFVYLFVALALGFLCGIFINSPNTQNAAANFVAMLFSFLGGAFVPLEFLGGGVLAVARFTPTYWYTSALSSIVSLTHLSWETLRPVFGQMLVQLGFAAALFSVALVVSKARRQSSRGFGRTVTEREA